MHVLIPVSSPEFRAKPLHPLGAIKENARKGHNRARMSLVQKIHCGKNPTSRFGSMPLEAECLTLAETDVALISIDSALCAALLHFFDTPILLLLFLFLEVVVSSSEIFRRHARIELGGSHFRTFILSLFPHSTIVTFFSVLLDNSQRVERFCTKLQALTQTA